MAEIQLEKTALGLELGSTPVSYTHLDVYKRQPEMLGRNHVYFLPYLMGERSPINDTNARAMFVGMTMDTARADMRCV